MAKSELTKGALALRDLIDRVDACTGNDFDQYPDSNSGPLDPRDYVAVVDLIAEALDGNYVNASARRREGFLRALADLICTVGDGFCLSRESWDPLKTTESAFAANRAAKRMLRPHVA